MPRLPRRPHDDVADLDSAIHWLRTAWTTLPTAPQRIHDRDVAFTEEARRPGCPCLHCTTADTHDNQGAPQFSHPMWRILGSRPQDTVDVTESVMCRHPQIPADASAFDCPSCLGAGFYDHKVARFRSPMAAALHRLSKMPHPSDGTPAPVEYVMALAAAGWDVRQAAQMLGYFVLSPDHSKTIDAMFLMNLRRLHGHYSAGPIGRVPYTELSESQRNAEDAA